jgi:predicted MFS family arabinose efflux permease
LGSLNFVKDKYIFLFVSFALWFSHFIYLPILTPHIELMGGKYTFIGIVLSSYGLMQFLFRLPIGIYSDIFRLRRPFIVAGMLISTTSCLVFALTDSLGWVLIARSLAGIAAATWVVFTVLYASYFVEQEVHQAMSSITFVVVLAQLLGMSLSGFIANEWGWHAPFWIGAMISIIGAILSLFIFETKKENRRVPVRFKDLKSVLKEPMLLKVSLLSILAHSIIFTTMFGFIPAYVVDIGLHASDISLVVFSFMIPHAIATLFMGKVIVPLLGKWKSLNIAFLASAFFTLLTPFIESKGLLMLNQGFNGFSLGILFPLLLGLAIESISHEKRATAMGVYQALYALGMFLGPFIAGVLNSGFGITAGFYFTGILGLIASILVITWSRKEAITLNENYRTSSLK